MRPLIACEHGGNEVPAAYRALFAGHEALLDSHRGWDPGALDLARRLAAPLACPLHFATVTRLLVDLNRSPGHPRQFSELTRPLPRREREALAAAYHRPYRDGVTAAVEALAAAPGPPVLHLSMHSFTPVWKGEIRRVDVGLLYDPARPAERAFCDELDARLRRALPGLLVRRNNPYRGTGDGLTTGLRRRLPADRYLGIEIEVNQKFPRGAPRAWDELAGVLVEEIAGAVGGTRLP